MPQNLSESKKYSLSTDLEGGLVYNKNSVKSLPDFLQSYWNELLFTNVDFDNVLTSLISTYFCKNFLNFLNLFKNLFVAGGSLAKIMGDNNYLS